MATVDVTWVKGDQFVASGDGGHSIVLDAPAGRDAWQGFMPSELLLAAVAGCTAVDVIDILRTGRQRVSGLRVTATGVQRESFPRAFVRIDLEYAVRGQGVSAEKVERAIALSHEKYCMVSATVSGVAEIQTSFTVVEDDAE